MRKIRFILLVFLCLLSIDVKAEMVINTKDIPLYSQCIGNGYSKANNAGAWSPAKWGNIPITNWSPLMAGIQSLPNNLGVRVRLVFSKEDIQFFKQAVFPNTNTRIPFALEIDVLDKDGVYGAVNTDDFYVASDNLPKTPAKMLILDVAFMDSIHQMSALISRPDLLEPYKIYEIELRSNNPNASKSGNISLNLQLSVNYKWLAAMRNGVSSSCDILALMYEVSGSLPTTNLVAQNYGANIPTDAIHGWYYFIAAQTDVTRNMKVPPDYANGGKNYSCFDDIENPAHNDSGSKYCHKLFDLTAGSKYGNFIKFVGNPKTYFLSSVDNQLWWTTDEATFYYLGGDFSKVIEYPADKYNDATTQYPISGSMTLNNGVLNTSLISTINLKQNDWTYDIGHTFSGPVYAGNVYAYSSARINLGGTEMSMEQAMAYGYIYSTAYLETTNGFIPKNTSSLVFNPGEAYTIWSFVPGLRIVLNGDMDKDKIQSITDMNTVAVADSRFVPYGLQDSFSTDPNWMTTYSLNLMYYPLVGGNITWVAQAVNKTNKSIRYICYLDPTSGLQTLWKQVK